MDGTRLPVGDQRFRTLVETVGSVIIVLDPEGRILEFNREAERVYGCKREEVLGLPYIERFLPADVQQRVGEDIGRVLAGQDTRDFENPIVAADGTQRILLWNASRIVDEQGRPAGLIASGLDITDRLRRDEELRRHGEELEAIFRAQPDLLFRLKVDGSILDYRVGRTSDLYVAPAIFLGRTMKDVLPGEVAVIFQDAFAQLAAGKPLVTVQYALDLGEAGLRHFEARLVPISNDEVLCIARDVTDRYFAAQQLEESEARYRDLVESASALIWTVDNRGRFTFVNREGARRLLGYEPEEILGRSFLELQTPEQAERDRAEMETTMNTGRSLFGYESSMLRKDGRIVHISATSMVRRDAAGQITGAIGTSIDVTETKRAEAERRALDERIRETQRLESLAVLAGGIAHDFNNLLVGILGSAELAMRDVAGETPLRTYLETIVQAAQRASDLSRQMLAYSGRGRFQMQAVDLSELAAEMANLLEATAAKKGRLHLALGQQLPAVHADVTQLRQVLMNLVTNAGDAIGDREGVIRVATGTERLEGKALTELPGMAGAEPGPRVFVEVSDTGGGMDDATRRRMFDPFFTTKFTGRGLGLAAVLGIVRGHRGNIRVESAPGCGTTVRVLLPPADGQAVPLPKDEPEAVSWRGEGLVLLADDEDTARAVTRRILEEAGFDVVEARDGRQAVELFGADPDRFVAVMVDLTMPRMGGDVVVREIRRLKRQVPLVLTSGYDEEDAIHRLDGQQIDAFVQKPYRADSMLAALRSALDVQRRS